MKMFLVLATLAVCGAAKADTFVNGVVYTSGDPMPVVIPQASDPAVLTEEQLLASGPRRTVTRSTTVSWSVAPVAAPAACGQARAVSACSSTRTVTRQRTGFRLFGGRLRGGC